MKKLFYAILLAMLIVPIFVQKQMVEKADAVWPFTDEPGHGFDSGDVCGFVHSVAASYPSIAALTATVNFGVVADANQGCVDENGYFFSSSARESEAIYSRTVGGTTTAYTLDFDFNTASNVFVDPTTGEWSGAARITSSSTPAIPPAQRWVDFDWDCSDSCGLDPEDYHVYTDMTTGAVNGYAWSDYFNSYISFNGLTQELPERGITTRVQILANDTDYGPDDVDGSTAPLADGAEYWRVKVQFIDSLTGIALGSDDLDSLAITVEATSDSNVYLNQVENSGDAIEESYDNTHLGCSSGSYCVITEDDGSESFNTFVYSGSPTSQWIGGDTDTDASIESPADRDGCIWIYADQGTGSCDGSSSTKEEVFFDRQSDRNKYEIDYINIAPKFAGDRDVSMYTYDTGSEAYVEVTGAAGTWWQYYPGEDAADLSYRPRFQISKFVSVFDGEDHTAISENASTIQYLRTEGRMSTTSTAFLSYSGAVAKPSYRVYYQMDATSSASSVATNDQKLLIDTDVIPSAAMSADAEATKRTDSLTAMNSSYTNYKKSYALDYDQTETYLSTCGTIGYAPCTAGTNTLVDPTAELWICDDAPLTTMSAGQASCYYAEYLEQIDRHAAPESMLVIGAINSVIDADDVLEEVSDTEGTVLSVLGTTETINLRNKMYAQVLRYTLGQKASSGEYTDDSGSCAPSSDLVELMDGWLVFAEGDVTIDCFDGSDKTLVVLGGDVYINTDITNGRMGIIAFKRDGLGGNVYVDNEVTDLYANMFLDGSLFSYDGTAPTGTVPEWGSDEERLEELMHQLYLKGSLVSRNTVNGAGTVDGSYDLGDGTTTTDYEVAREYDLNMIRQYRQCHPIKDGAPDTTTREACNEGEKLSEYGQANGTNNSFILDYEPADGLPVFQVESGLFN